mmetsp:Transcript_102509/g.295099  ORF Transcript_102509/g.295099 Transcript_102509/m.295099 type:complete len:245 (-) Transcript_102509:155-889(-)
MLHELRVEDDVPRVVGDALGEEAVPGPGVVHEVALDHDRVGAVNGRRLRQWILLLQRSLFEACGFGLLAPLLHVLLLLLHDLLLRLLLKVRNLVIGDAHGVILLGVNALVPFGALCRPHPSVSTALVPRRHLAICGLLGLLSLVPWLHFVVLLIILVVVVLVVVIAEHRGQVGERAKLLHVPMRRLQLGFSRSPARPQLKCAESTGLGVVFACGALIVQSHLLASRDWNLSRSHGGNLRRRHHL